MTPTNQTHGNTADARPDAPPAPAGTGVLVPALRGARRRWFLASLAGGLLGGGVGAAYYHFQPQKYTVHTTLRINPNESLLATRDGNNPTALNDYWRAQTALVKTRPVLAEAVRAKGVADLNLIRTQADPVGWLEVEVKTGLGEGGLLRVALTAENADEAAAVLNAVVAAYLSQVIDAEKNQSLAKMSEVDQVLVSVEDQLRRQQETFSALAKSLHTTDSANMSLQQKNLLQQYGQLSSELLELDKNIRATSVELEAARAAAETVKTSPIPDQVIAEALDNDSSVRAAMAEARAAQEELDRNSKILVPNSPLLDKFRAAKATAEARVEVVRGERKETVTSQLRVTLAKQAEADTRKAEAKLRSLDLQRKAAKQDADRLYATVEKFGTTSIELHLKKAEIDQTESVAKELRAKKAQLGLEMQTYKRRVNVFYPAEGAGAKPTSSPLNMAAGLGAAGFAAGVFGVGFLESRRRRLVKENDLSHTLKLRILGTMPDAPEVTEVTPPEVWTEDLGLLGSLVIEAVNDIRVMLLSGGPGTQPKTVMLTSATQGEGKTTLSCLLGLSFAHTWKRTLLIDGDLRKPRVHERFGRPPGPGLAEVLRGEATFAQVIQEIPGTNLSILPAGRACPRVIRGLTAETFRGVFAPLRERYDIILIDSCPTAPVSDGLVMSQTVDATVMVVRSGYSNEAVVRTAYDRLKAVNAKVVGGIMNGLPATRRWSAYHYAYLPAPGEGDPTQTAAPTLPAGPRLPAQK